MPEATPTPITTGPDAELLAALAEFIAVEERRAPLYDREPGDETKERAMAALDDRQQPLFDRLLELRAMTPEGIRARAETLARYEPGIVARGLEGGDWVECMVAAIVRDLLGLPTGNAPGAGAAEA